MLFENKVRNIVEGVTFLSSVDVAAGVANTFTAHTIPSGSIYADVYSAYSGNLAIGTTTSLIPLFGILDSQTIPVRGFQTLFVNPTASGAYNVAFYGVA